MLIPNGWRSETKRGRDKLRGDGFGIGCRFVLALPCSGFACEITGGERRWPDGRWGEGRKLLAPVVGWAAATTTPNPNRARRCLAVYDCCSGRGTLRLTCGPRVACCRLILFLGGGGVRAAPRRQIWRPDLSTDFHGLAVHVPFETTGTGARTDAASAVAAWQESSFPRHRGREIFVWIQESPKWKKQA